MSFRRLALGLAALAFAALAAQGSRAQSPFTQCITNAAAGGTGDAITVPLLPCGLATNIMLLTLAASNTTTTPTLQMTGYAALPIKNADGSALSVGELPGAGVVVMLTGTGSEWLVLTSPATGAVGVTTTGSPVAGNLTEFSSPNTITRGDIYGDCTTSGNLDLDCVDYIHSWNASQQGKSQTLVESSGTFTPNFATGNNFVVPLGPSCPCTIANSSTTPVAGQAGVMVIEQDATGGRTIGTWGSEYLYAGGTANITQSSGASAIDALSYYVIDSTHILLTTSSLNASH